MSKHKLNFLLMLPLVVGLGACTSKVLVLHQDTTKSSYTIDVYNTNFIEIDLDETLKEKDIEGLSFEASPETMGGITVSDVQDGNVINVFSIGELGLYKINVIAFVNEEDKLHYDLDVSVVDNTPAPTLIKNVQTIDLDCPKFPHKDSTLVSTSIDLTEYVDASDSVTYQLDVPANSGISMEVSQAKVATLHFKKVGSQEVKINAIFKGSVALTLTFTVNVTAKTTNNLFNGDFERGFDGWDLDEFSKLSYEVIDNPVDIWGNKINQNGKYLYGYKNENGTGIEITSSLFKVEGLRYVTMKLAGNCTDNLYISLMQYNDSGDDIEIAKFNNWFYPISKLSGFIFNDYVFQIPQQYAHTSCYFVIHDDADASIQGGFGFINVDEIKTYYTEAPANLNDYYEAGFKVNPETPLDLDMSDTSNKPFTTENVPYQLPNGDFEQGYDHWFMTRQDKEAYGIVDGKLDIWSNKVNATKHYLYGYQKENYTGTFHSDLFKAGGSGFMTFKIAGNSTSDLQFKLMKYVADGEDVLIDKFNNTYFQPTKRNHSGFIFQEYYYELDMNSYRDSLLYFEVYDARTADFGFICLDDIVTYYETKPSIQPEWFKASFVTEAE